MNSYQWEDLKLGMEESFTVTVTEDMLNSFYDITGDSNPMHRDAEYAKKRGYQDRLVYGMLTASFYSTLAGVYLPGEHCILQECQTSFHLPVYIGDTITVTGKITELHDVFRRVTVKAVIRNQAGKKVSKATLIAGVIEDGT